LRGQESFSIVDKFNVLRSYYHGQGESGVFPLDAPWVLVMEGVLGLWALIATVLRGGSMLAFWTLFMWWNICGKPAMPGIEEGVLHLRDGATITCDHSYKVK
jgi:hypothetical protein